MTHLLDLDHKALFIQVLRSQMFLYNDAGARLLTHLLIVESFSRLHRLVVNFGRSLFTK